MPQGRRPCRVALDAANTKFARRFEAVEALARERGLRVGDVPLGVLDGLWDDVKARERLRSCPEMRLRAAAEERRRSRPQAVHHPRERDRPRDVRQSADPRHGALESEPEARVDEGAVSAQVEIPPIGVHRQPLRDDAARSWS